MRPNWLVIGVIAATALGGFHTPGQAQSAPETAPSAGQRITIIGTVKRVETAKHEVVFAGDDGHDYVVNVSHAKITLPGGALAMLVPSMRVYVSGHLSGASAITAIRLQVLPIARAVPAAAAPPVAASAEPPDLTVRGTVESVDLEQGAFVLRVNTHTRIVFVTADTNVSGLGPPAAGRFPVQPGKRVTVGGSLQPNGTVLAGLLTDKGDPDYQTLASLPNRVLVGTVSSPPNKLRSRDFKVRAEDGSETRISVPRGIPIRRLGRSISVYDLSRRDEVRITGRLSASGFQAYRIDVLAPPPDPASSAPPPSRPGL